MRNTFKKITAAVMAATTLAISTAETTMVSPLPANAAQYRYTYQGYDQGLPVNILTFSKTVSASYSKISAEAGWTEASTTNLGNNTGYTNSYKRATYSEYKNVDGVTSVYYYDANTGTSEKVKTDSSHDIGTKAVKRVHTTKLHAGSNSSSIEIEELYVTVIKAGFYD